MSEDNQYIFTHEKGGVSRLITELFLFIIPQFIAIAVVSSYAQYFTSSSQPTSYAPQIVFLLLFAALTLGLINLAKSSYSSVVYKLLFFFAIIQGLRIVAGMSFHGIA
ncbi:hypothetical protein IT409_01530, partial [Candidatus Falkowbacteria bacterium]|nr:hypothetical protein [Candidatus Falkowbacteria bacterium]